MSKNLIVFIHQPDFLPWIGFFEKLKVSDVYVVLDDVQFIRRGWINRDKIIINNNPGWLTVPVKSKGNYKEIIKNIKIDHDINWVEDFVKIFVHNYNKFPHYKTHVPNICNILKKKQKYLIDLNLELIEYVTNYFKIKKEMIFSSSLNLSKLKDEKIIEILKKLNATEYVTGMGSKNYLDENVFKKENIKLNFYDNSTQKENSKFNFREDLSIFDLMLRTNKIF